jgi:outer membrane protein
MMKKQISILALALGMMLSFNAVSQKLGHIDAEALLQQMPETKAAQTEIEAYGKQLEKDLQDMQAEYTTKTEAFIRDEPMMTNLAKETRTKEIQELQVRIQEYSQRAQLDLQQKQVELLNPIIEKATNAVKEVAAEGKFNYIMDSSQSKAVLIYVDGGEDVMDKVKAKLGIQ